jgi:hypothetical protein
MFCDSAGGEVPVPAVQRRQLAIGAPRAINNGVLAVGWELSDTGEGSAEFLTYRRACESYASRAVLASRNLFSRLEK